MRSVRGRSATWITAVLAVAMVGAGCGSDDGGDAATTVAPSTASDGGAVDSTPAPGAPVGGCGHGAVVDPADRTAGRPVARCDAGAPAPQPLPERTTITVANLFKGEHVGPLLLAEAMGEFDEENLDVEIVPVAFADAVPQMATGTIDVTFGAPDSSLFNANATGVDIDWVLGNFYPPSAGDVGTPQTGIWARRDLFSTPDEPDLAELEGAAVASATASGSIIDYPIAEALAGVGLTSADLDISMVPSPDMMQALRNGAVDAAWLLDPFWLEAANDPDYELVVTQPAGEPLGGAFMAADFVRDERPAAVAFVRAMIRTINTYLAGDYQSDPDVVEALANAISVDTGKITETPSLVFDWEIRDGTATRAQAQFIANGSLRIDEPLTEADVVDRSLYLEAVGAVGGD